MAWWPTLQFSRIALARSLGLWIGLRGLVLLVFLFAHSGWEASLHPQIRVSIAIAVLAAGLSFARFRKPAERIFWANAGIADGYIAALSTVMPLLAELVLRRL